MQIDKSNEIQHSGIIGKAKDWVKSNITGKATAEVGEEKTLLSEVDDYSGQTSRKLPGIGTCTKAGATLGGAVGGATGLLTRYSNLKTDGKPEIGPGVVHDILDPKLVGQQDTVTPSGNDFRHVIKPVIVEEKIGTYTSPQVTYKKDIDVATGGILGIVGGTIIGGAVGLVTGVVLKIIGAVGGHGEKIESPPENKGEEKSGRGLGGTLGVLGGAAAGAAGGLYLAEKTREIKDAYAPTIPYQSPVYKHEIVGYTNMDFTSSSSKPLPSAPAAQFEPGPPGSPPAENLPIYRPVPQRNPDGSIKLEELYERPTSGIQNPVMDKIFMAGLGGIIGAMGAIAINTIVRVVTGGEKSHK
ncbi:MAG: hypothetical protein V2A78_09325 [bacterium]